MTSTASPSLIRSALRIDFFIGSTYTPVFESGKIEVVQVDAPVVALTRMDPNARAGRGRSRMSAESSAGSETKNQLVALFHAHSGAVKVSRSSIAPMVSDRAATVSRKVVSPTGIDNEVAGTAGNQAQNTTGGNSSGGIATARAESVARTSYGRLLAILAAPTGDIPAAEDALADAFEQALRLWPLRGVPENPEGWLVTVARNRLRDQYKSSVQRTSVPLGLDGEPTANPFDTTGTDSGFDLDGIPDKRLALMFVCAHPAIDAGIRTALMLQTVLGFESKHIAVAFAIPAPAMAGRLVRAKRRIRDARIPFAVPDRRDLPARLPAVLEAIYGAYAIDWQRVSGETLRESLSGEALYLAETLAILLEDEPEAFGLAALICLSLSRASARTAPDGAMVPLDQQDTALWDAELISRGEAHLRRAHGLGHIGRFQLEAALQSVHCNRARSGTTDWGALRRVNEALVRIAPTLGAYVSLAATLAEIDGPAAGLAFLDSIDTDVVSGAALRCFQPAWATRAHLLAALGRTDDASLAYDRAISLTADAAQRAYLVAKSHR